MTITFTETKRPDFPCLRRYAGDTDGTSKGMVVMFLSERTGIVVNEGMDLGHGNCKVGETSENWVPFNSKDWSSVLGTVVIEV